MAVTSLRRHLMPGFTELAADMTLADLLGTEAYGALLRLCLAAEPSADLPGSWVIVHTQADLAAYLGYSANKTGKLLALLCEAQALVRERGIRLGRGMGATSDRYFVAAVPGLVTPGPAPPGEYTPPAYSRHRFTSHNYTRQEVRLPMAGRAPHGYRLRTSSIDHLSELTDDNSSHEAES